MMFIVANNIIASRPPERPLTSLPVDRLNADRLERRTLVPIDEFLMNK